MTFRVLTSQGFEYPVTELVLRESSIINSAKIILTLQKTFFTKTVKLSQNDLDSIHIFKEEVTNDAGKRVQNAAIGAFLLGAVGLLGAAIGGEKKLRKMKITTKDSKVILAEGKSKDCLKLFKQMGGDLEKALYDKYLNN